MNKRCEIQLFIVSLLSLAMFSCLESLPLNVAGVVCDSVSHDTLPLVKITIKELGKSFTSTRRVFYIALEAGSYTFEFKAEAYETLHTNVAITTEGEEFLFEMVKHSDRLTLNKRADSLYLYMQGFNHAIDQQNVEHAFAYMVACQRFNASSSQMDSMKVQYLETKQVWVDSVFIYAQTLEDSQKVSDAYFYYNKILAVDSLHEGAQQRIAETEEALTNKIEGKTQPSSGTGTGTGTTTTMNAEQIESIFNQAVSKFLAEDYKGTLLLLQTVLKHNPNHEGAKNYLSRTQSRLQAIK